MSRITIHNKDIQYRYNSNNTIPPLNDLPNKDLEYKSISYMPFLLDSVMVDKEEKGFIFNFSQTKFNNATILGDLGIIELISI